MELQADESHPNILDLPDEVMVEIFSYITPQELHKSMAAVCRRWEQVAYEPSLWRNLSVQDEDLAPCMRTNPGLNEGCREKRNTFLDVCKTTATRLDSFSCRISDKVLTERIIKDFKPINTGLKHLQLLEVPVGSSILKNEITHTSLLSLSLNGFTFQRLNPFPDFSNLKCLHVEGCTSVRLMVDPAATNFLSNLKNLVETCFHLEAFTIIGMPISEDMFVSLLNTTRGKLKTLGFTTNIYLNPFWISEIERSISSSLVKLVVNIECYGYRFEKRENLLGLRNLSSLEHLEFSCKGEVQWVSSSLKNLFYASTFINLKVLIIDNVSEKGDALLQYIAWNFHKLKRLRMCRWSGVTESGISQFLSKNKSIQDLELIELDTQLTIETFMTIPESLQNLTIHFCDSIDHNAISDIASRHPCLNINYIEDPYFCLKDLLQ